MDGRNQPFHAVLIKTSSAELLLYRQIGVRAIASEHPVEKDLVPIEDLYVHVGGRGIEHDRPSERLEGRMRQRPACMGVPLSTWASRRRSHREEQDRLDAVQGIVREQRTMIPRAGGEHLISLSQHVDRAGGIGHDLLSQPVLEGRDHPIIAIVDDQEGIPRLILLLDHHLPDELRPLNPERVVGRRPTIAAAPAIFPSGAPITSSSRSGRIGWSFGLTWDIVTPGPRVLWGSIPLREPECRDLPARCRGRRPLNRWERHVTGMIYLKSLISPTPFFWGTADRLVPKWQRIIGIRAVLTIAKLIPQFQTYLADN